MPYTVYLKKGEEKRVLQGHSWVYANEVARIDGKDKNGSLATVCAYDGKFIGKGYINHLSKILVRIFIRDENQIDDENLYIERITKAKAVALPTEPAPIIPTFIFFLLIYYFCCGTRKNPARRALLCYRNITE